MACAGDATMLFARAMLRALAHRWKCACMGLEWSQGAPAEASLRMVNLSKNSTKILQTQTNLGAIPTLRLLTESHFQSAIMKFVSTCQAYEKKIQHKNMTSYTERINPICSSMPLALRSHFVTVVLLSLRCILSQNFAIRIDSAGPAIASRVHWSA